MLTAEDFFEAVHIARWRAGLSERALNRAIGSNGINGPVTRSHRKRAGSTDMSLENVAAVLTVTGTTPEQWARDVEAAREARERREMQEFLGSKEAA